MGIGAKVGAIAACSMPTTRFGIYHCMKRYPVVGLQAAGSIELHICYEACVPAKHDSQGSTATNWKPQLEKSTEYIYIYNCGAS